MSLNRFTNQDIKPYINMYANKIDVAEMIANKVTTVGELVIPLFVDAEKPDPTDPGEGSIIFISDTGIPLYSDGVNWKKFSDDSIVP